jgi:DNA-binding CsgD family transcriptional regulator
MPGSDRRQHPLVGREPEWRILREALEAVRQGGSRQIFIEGEAGIGKTRLVEEIARTATAAGVSLFSGRAEDLERLRPFGALVDGVDRLVHAGGSEMSRLETVLRGPTRSAAPLDVIDAFTEFIEERAMAGPTCVILEDLHWADPDTISAVRAMSRRLTYLPILICGTYRPHPQLPELSRLIDVSLTDDAVDVRLEPLDNEAMLVLARELLGTPIGPQLESMLDACSGNPLYAAELIHALQEQGSLSFIDGTTDATAATLPPSLRLTILRRLSQFSTDVIATLKNAAVLGSSFQLHELAAFCAKPVTEIVGKLQGPIAAKIIQERDGKLAFRHDLIHEAIYEDIPKPIRASMHADTSRVLRSAGAPAVRIAEHVTRGLDLGDPALISEVPALMDEIRLPAPRVTLTLGDKALKVPGASEQQRDEIRRFMMWPLALSGRRSDALRFGLEILSRPHDPAFAGTIRYLTAAVLSEGGQNREAIESFDALMGDIASSPSLARLVRIGLAAIRLRSGVFQDAPLAAEMAAGARNAEDLLSLTFATGVLTAALVGQGHVSAALDEADRYIEMESTFRSMIPTPYFAPAIAYTQADLFHEARQVTEKGRRHASEVGESAALCVYSALDSLISFTDGSWNEAHKAASAALDSVTHEDGAAWMVVLSQGVLAHVLLHRGSVAEAADLVSTGEVIITERGPQLGTDLFMWAKARHLEATGDLAGALSAFSIGWRSAEDGHFFVARQLFGELVRLAVLAGDRDLAQEVTLEAEDGMTRAQELPSVVGSALRCRGLFEGDADVLVAAVEAYRNSPRAGERAAACEDAAIALLRSGKSADARSLFEEALTFYEDVETAHDVRRISSLMRSAGLRRGSREKRARPKTGWESLTASEQQVARLTVEGLTNPQIAERLFVSKHTVQTHLSHVFAKLGISSRTALAGMAAEKLGSADKG